MDVARRTKHEVMNSFAALSTELASLSAEARRKYADVREACDRAIALCKTPEDALRDLQRGKSTKHLIRLLAEPGAEDGPSSTVLTPILQGCQTKNAKIIVLSVACLQRLVAIRGAVSQHSAPAILENLRAVLNQGVEIQLKILQTLVALLQNGKDIHGDALADALLLCFKLQDSKIGQVSSTAAGILRQLVIIIFDGVLAEDRAASEADSLVTINLPDGAVADVRPCAADAFHIFEDLCILVGAQEGASGQVHQPELLKLPHLQKSLGIELIESILADFVRVFLTHPELIAVLRLLLAPLVLKGLSERPSPFSSMTRFMRLGFLLMSKYHNPLQQELEVFLHFYVRVIDGTGTHGSEENWTRVLALEVMRGICNDFDLLLKVWILYQSALLDLLAALGKIATEKPALLGSTSGSQSTPSLVLPGGIAGDAVNSVLEMAAQAATSVGVLPTVGQVAGLSAETASVKQQCIDQLNKAEAPTMPETYPYYLALQCLTAVATGFHAFVATRYVQQHPPSSVPPPALNSESEPANEALKALRPARSMVEAAWPALLSSLSFFLSTNLDDQLFESTLAAHQAFTKTCGMLDLATPRDAFLTSLCRYAVPPPNTTEFLNLSERNEICLKAVIGVASTLAGSLGPAWLLVFECLQNAEASMRKSTAEANALFVRSKSLDDHAFAAFLAAICRLDGEVIGMPVTEAGALDLEEAQSPIKAGMQIKRRASTLTVKRTLRPGEKTIFGITRLEEVAMLNLDRLTQRDARLGWDIVISHLLAVAHWTAAPSPIRLQAAQVLDQLLEAALKQAGETMQPRILEALADQSEAEDGPQSTTDFEIRRMGLDALFRMLESAGHSLNSGWQPIFSILGSACPGRLVKVAFPSIQLVCTDFLAALTSDEMRLCITTLADFGRQEDDVNIALTAGGLLWQISDHLQSRKRQATNEVDVFSKLWMLLLQQLLSLTDDERQEVRDGAIQTIFRSLELYGDTLAAADWHTCLWEIMLPLLDSLDAAIRTLPAEVMPLSPTRPTSMTEALARPRPGLSAKQWDDSKTLALSSFGSVFAEHFEQILQTSRFGEVWSVFLMRCKDSFCHNSSNVAVAAMRAFARVVAAAPDSADLRDVAWRAWEGAAAEVSTSGEDKTITQASLDALVIALPKPFTPSRHARLLELLRAVLLYSKSDDMRQDVDATNALQVSVLNAVDSIPIDDGEAAARQLKTFAEYATFAFDRQQGAQATYVGLFKAALPRAAALLEARIHDHILFTSGAVASLLRALATPIRLKYGCPAAVKFAEDQPLWLTATTFFIKTAKLCVSELASRGGKLPERTYSEIFEGILSACKDALLADCRPSLSESLVQQREVEMLDLEILSLIELDLLPHLGQARLADSLISSVAETLASASRIYNLDLPGILTPPLTPDADDAEPRFSLHFAQQALPSVFGTTAGIIEAPKERVAYWCWDLLFQLCQADASWANGGRIAKLALPALVNRCEASLRTYLVDRPLQGSMPYPRVREEEIVYALNKLHTLRIDGEAFADAILPVPSSHISPAATLLKKSPRAHLVRMHQLLVALVALPRPGVALPPVIFDDDAEAEAAARGLALGQIGRKSAPIIGGMHDLALACLYEIGQELAM